MPGCRLLTTFRAVYGGVRHERLKLLALRRQAVRPRPVPLPRRPQPGTTWKDRPGHAAAGRQPDGAAPARGPPGPAVEMPAAAAEARRLSFRALDIEQIGHVYEGLLDHTAKRATEPVLGLLPPRDNEPEVALAELERLTAKGEADLLKFLEGRRRAGRRTPSRRPWTTRSRGIAARKIPRSVRQREELFNRVRPFSGLVRNDTFDRPVVIRTGSSLRHSGDRPAVSGTHYTPRSLTEPIVQYTLEPLVYVGPAEGKPKEEWKLRSAKELLDLKICDMACGSGAFLVQACRYLAERWPKPGRTPRTTPAVASNDSISPRRNRTRWLRITALASRPSAIRRAANCMRN